MRRLFLCTVFAVAIGSLLLGGCSVYMAAAGDEEPNISNVKTGASRGEVELALGQPVQVSTLEDKKTAAVYEYTLGNEPSAGRAIGHAALDVVTLGIWEVVGTPIEGFNQGDKVRVNVTYDEHDKVESINSSKK